MKATGTCPKCQCAVLWYVESVAANHSDLGFTTVHPTFALAVTGKGVNGLSGVCEAYACQQCGYVELYLKERLTADGQYVRELRRPPASPYRQ
jgi:predicted nucleic-acid-binding Zn-ribbon protein